jgi:hypothetical protein
LKSLNGRDHSEDPDIDGRIILKWILGKQDVRVRTVFIWLSTGTDGGLCEHRREPSSSMKGDEFLDQLSDYVLLKDSAPWS